MNTSDRKRKQGFTLVESVIATFILILGLGVVGLTFNMAVRLISSNRNQMLAMHVARDELERLRIRPFASPTLNAGTYSLSTPRYTGAYTVSDVSANLKNITLSIAYNNDMTRGASQARLSTTLARPLH